MFNEIIHDLNRKLSEKGVHLYDSFSFKVKKNREALNHYGNIAVFTINTGTLQLLDGNRGMTVEAVLHFVFRVEEETASPTKIEDVLDHLITNNNGLITDTGKKAPGTEPGAREREPFRYVMTFDLYRPVGEIKAMSDMTPDRFVAYDLPMQIIISRALMFGDDFKIYFQTGKKTVTEREVRVTTGTQESGAFEYRGSVTESIDRGEIFAMEVVSSDKNGEIQTSFSGNTFTVSVMWTEPNREYRITVRITSFEDYALAPLKNVVYWEETPLASYESPNFVNEGIQKNLFVAKGWDLKGKFMFDPNDSLCRVLEGNAHTAPETVYTILYELGGKVYEAEAYLALSHSGSMRQFVAVDFAFHLHGELTELSDADAAAFKESWTV